MNLTPVKHPRGDPGFTGQAGQAKAAQEHDNHTRIIVIEINKVIVGFVVDSVSEVLRIPANTVEPPPPIVAGIESEYISGVGKLADRLLILLDLDRLLSSGEQSMLSGLLKI